MTDILQKLRCTIPCQVMDPASGCHCAEAASEIERLRAALHDSKETSLQLLGQVGQLSEENEAVRAANRDVMLHWDVLKADHDRLRAALTEIRDAGPMTVDDQRWRVAKDALEGKHD